jgi:hypothetical protein
MMSPDSLQRSFFSPLEPSATQDDICEHLAVNLSDIPQIYDRLLKQYLHLTASLEVNPFQSQWSLWFNSLRFNYRRIFAAFKYVAKATKNPNRLAIAIPCSEQMLGWLERFGRKELQAIRECNTLNLRETSRGYVLNNLNVVLIGIATIIGALKTTADVFKFDLSQFQFDATIALLYLVGGLISHIFLDYLFLYHRIARLRAIDALLSIAQAYHDGRS